MFLTRKGLIIHNQKRVKKHLESIKKELLQEVERIVNEEDLKLHHQEDDNLEILAFAMKNVLTKNLKLWSP